MTDQNFVTIDPALEARESFITFEAAAHVGRHRRQRGGRTGHGQRPVAAAARRSGRLPRLPGVDGGAVGYRPAGDLLRPAGLRQLGPAGRPGALDGRLLPARDRCGARRAGPRAVPHPGPELGRHAAHGIPRATSGRRRLGDRRQLARRACPVGPETAKQRAALPPEVIEVLDRHEAAGTWDDPEYEAAVQVFYDRHLCRVVPGARVRPALVRQARPQPAGLPDHERTDRVPCRGHAPRLGDPVAPGRRRWAGAADERPPRRGHADADGAHRRIASRRPNGCCSSSPATCPTRRSPTATWPSLPTSWPARRPGRGDDHVPPRVGGVREGAAALRSAGAGALTGRPGPARP